MAERKVTSYRMPTVTEAQIKALAAQCGMSRANVITMAVDRMHREEIKMSNTNRGTAQQVWEQYVGSMDGEEFAAGFDSAEAAVDNHMTMMPTVMPDWPTDADELTYIRHWLIEGLQEGYV